MKKGSRSSLIKNLLAILFIIIAIVSAIFSEELTNGFILGVLFFGIAGIYILCMPVEPFLNIIYIFKNKFK